MVAAVAGLALLVGCGSGEQRFACDSYEFDAQSWATESSPEDIPSERQRQFDAMQRCGTLKGMTRAGVIEMLGTYEMHHGRSRRYGGSDFIQYDIGYTSKLGDTDGALIYFDRMGRVFKVVHPTLPWADDHN